MRLSRYFLPTLKETPSEAQIVSHRLMLRAGLIRQEAAGIYAWLPLGLRVLKKIEQIVREEQERAGAVEILMPTIQLAALWRECGRYDAYVALGVVIRGETYHFEVVSNESARGIMALTLDGLAIGNGILTVENEEQALARADKTRKDKGGEAAKAALAMLALKEQFGIG